MLKKTFTLFVMLFVATSLVFAQSATQVFDKAPKPVFENLALDKNLPGSNPSLPHTATAVLIGKMWNAYSTQASYTNQIFTDPFSGLISVVHRVDRTGAGSGRIVYQGSDDGGQNWTPQIGPMNLAPWILGRHPNIVLSNPTKSTTPGEQVPVAGWAELSASWRWYQFARDQAFGTVTFTQYIDSTYYPGDEMFVNSQGHVFAPVENIDPVVYGSDTVFYHLFVSTDQGSTWTKYPLAKNGDVDNYNGMKGFINKNGVGYIVFEAQQPGSGKYTFAYKKTTDDGATWDANWTWVDPFTLPALSGKVHVLNYEVDAIVDGAGNLHFAGTFVDTVNGANTGIYHIWGQGNTWDAKFVKKVNVTRRSLPGGLSTLNEVEFATNWDGTIGVLKFCDVPTPNDTLYDVFMTPVWGAPMNVQNITNTPAVHEKFSQTSAFGYMQDATTFRVDCMYTIFGNGDTNDLTESELWYLSGVTFQLTSVNDQIASPNKFELQQNYPNPFNPTTTIRFTIPEKSMVTLKVYDMLGREVTTLVNEVKDAGTHTVKFAGKDLPSGMYLYTLTAGNYTATKKMMLVK
jgi:hypothetical protein